MFGSARTKPETAEYQQAVAFGKAIIERGFMVITGGGEGIMGAAQRGAGRDNSFGLNIRLPFEQEPNIEIAGDRKLINFKYFFYAQTLLHQGERCHRVVPRRLRHA